MVHPELLCCLINIFFIDGNNVCMQQNILFNMKAADETIMLISKA